MSRATEKILEYPGLERAMFIRDEMLQVWVVYHLAVIGEAARHLPEMVFIEHPEVDWAAVTGLRHRLVHGYFAVDLDLVWETVSRDLPTLKAQLEDILESMPEDD